MKKLIKKADPLFYEKVGKFIELWLKDNSRGNTKPRTQKELAYMLKKTPAQLSRWIRGINQMPASVITQMSHLHGFNMKYYEEHIAQKNSYSLDHLTKEDLFRLIREMQIAHERQSQYFSTFIDTQDRRIRENYELVKMNRQLVEEVYKQREKINELRKQLRLAEE